MARRLRTEHGFTLMELMIVVAILGILASIAVPTFTMLMYRAKAGEVSANLNNLFKSASTYYAAERSGKGQNSSVTGYCTVGDSNPSPLAPTKSKQRFTATPEFRALGFSIADDVYFSYSFATGGGSGYCGHTAGSSDLYTLTAHGDLDQDGIQSTFELAVGSDSNNVLYHAVGFYMDKDFE